MEIFQKENELIIKETPGCFWLFGLFFVSIGALFVYGSGGGFVNSHLQSPLVLAAAFFMGCAGIGCGIWLIYQAPVTKVVVHRDHQKVWLTRWGLFGRRDFLYKFDDIKQFCLQHSKDSEGDDYWTFVMELADGEKIPITSIGSHAENYESKFVFQTNEFMGKQLSPTELIFELEAEISDENK